MILGRLFIVNKTGISKRHSNAARALALNADVLAGDHDLIGLGVHDLVLAAGVIGDPAGAMDQRPEAEALAHCPDVQATGNPADQGAHDFGDLGFAGEPGPDRQ